MAIASYSTLIRKGGSPTALTDEPMQLIGGSPNDTYQITDQARRVLDRDTVPTFADQGQSPDAINASDILEIDYLFGIVTFATEKIGPVVVSTGNYMPMTDIACAHAYNLTHAGTVLDSTKFETNADGNRKRILGLRDVNISVSKYDDISNDHLTFFDAINDRTPLIIEVRPGGGDDTFRGWFVVEAQNHNGGIDDLESDDLTFQLDGDFDSSYSFMTDSA